MSGVGRSVLVVDADEASRVACARALRRADYRVVAAADGLEALEVCLLGDVDLLLAEVQLPGLSGYEVAAYARAIRPPIAIMFMMAAIGDAAGQDLAEARSRHVWKPFHPATLIAAVAETLGVRERELEAARARTA